MMFQKPSTQPRGVIAVTMILWVSVFALSILSTAGVLVGNDLRSSAVQFSGTNTFMAAEAGVNDALYKLSLDFNQASYNLGTVGTSTVAVAITGASPSRTITSTATDAGTGVVRTVEVVVGASSFGGINGAIMAATGGLIIDQTAQVNGDVYTNASINGGNNSRITGNVTVAGANQADNVDVIGNLYAHTIRNLDVTGDAFYSTLTGTVRVNGANCPNPACHPGSPDPAPIDFPPTAMENYLNITVKNQAAAGGTINCSPTCSIAAGSAVIGPKKYVGNVTFTGGGDITLNGSVWVTGNILFDHPNQNLRLPVSHGANSDALIADGTIELGNNTGVIGSGDPKSFIIVASYSSQNTGGNPAIKVKNNAASAVFYAPNGWIELVNGTNLNNATGKTVHLNNGVTVTYNTNLQFLTIAGSSTRVVKPALGTWHEK